MAGELSIIHIKWDQRMPKVSPPPGHFSLALGGILWALTSAVCHILSTSNQPQSGHTDPDPGGRGGGGAGTGGMRL